ncbi:MAG: hypothetical protein HZA10_07995 [Nitrospirae bacterium]|nr:hypothetical protein [Nitrospirota bacterium]
MDKDTKLRIRYFKKVLKRGDMTIYTETFQTRIDTDFAPIGLDEPYRVFISEDPIGFDGGDVNLMAYVGNNPVNRIDPLGLFDNPLLQIPSFSEAFPNSNYVAPIADIVTGGIEGGFSVSMGVASAVGLAAGPEAWWIPVIFGGAAIEAGADSIDRISTGIERLGNNQTCK